MFESSLWDTFSCLFKKRIGLQSIDVFALSLLSLQTYSSFKKHIPYIVYLVSEITMGILDCNHKMLVLM